MEKEFRAFVNKHKLFKKADALLVAVSGGIDSVVLLHLLNKTGFKFAIAHCNFQLRGSESDTDEMFVTALANKYGCKIFIERFDTSKYAKENGMSIQMAARELRYNFFEQVRAKNKLKYTATAHHATDNVETILINILREAGVKSLQGIPIKNKNVVRPLLSFTRQQVEKYCHAEKLKWKEDSSNASDNYVRNKLRHHVLPVLKEINPSVEHAFLSYSQMLAGVHEVISQYAFDVARSVFKNTKDGVIVNAKELKALKLDKTIWFEIFKVFNFTPDIIHKLFSSKLKPGKFFLSPTYKLYIDRQFWTIAEIKTHPQVDITIKKAGTFHFSHFSIQIKKVRANQVGIADIKSNKIKNTAYFDADDLEFPLTVRTFKAGDFFYPIGMKGKKLISDYYTDNKFSLLQKEKQLLLLCDKQIAWVMGERMSEKFKVTGNTTSIYKLEYKLNE